jgi:ABC-type nickel/cobalt efflux system permease component RcnA
MSTRLTVGFGAIVALLLAMAWLQGWFTLLAFQAADAQREVQNAIAGAIRQIKAGNPGALAALTGLCFGYGVAHAIGPGHGKIVLGAYALSHRVSARRLILVSLAASLAQAGAAIALVYAGVLVFSWSREQMTGMAEQNLTAASYLMIGAIGLYIAWRSLRLLAQSLRSRAATPEGKAVHDHGHSHHGHDHGDGCDHAHGPTLDEIAKLNTWRDGLLLVAGVAIRPCSGALLVLLLCWRIGNNMAGILGVLAMGLGTAVITIIAALLALSMREGAWSSQLNRPGLGVLSGGLGFVAGMILVVTSVMLVQPVL